MIFMDDVMAISLAIASVVVFSAVLVNPKPDRFRWLRCLAIVAFLVGGMWLIPAKLSINRHPGERRVRRLSLR